MFMAQDEEDEETSGLAQALEILVGLGKAFTAKQVAELINSEGDKAEKGALLRETLLGERADPAKKVTPKAVGKRLQGHRGAPVRLGEQTLTLKAELDPHTRAIVFSVQVKANE
jgi:hypothetical protein